MKQSDKFRSFMVVLILLGLGLPETPSLWAQGKQATTQSGVGNLIIITTDGLRWQEVFNGMDVDLANQSQFNQGDSLYLFRKYGANTAGERQKLLLPFVWNTLVKQGQLYGNRYRNNKVDVANPYWFSYPGYNEIFTGFPDTTINSNSYPPNPHSNFLAYLNRQKEYKGKVIAFSAWEAFNRILNEEASGFPVINSFRPVESVLKDPISHLLSNMLKDSYQPFKKEECLDMFTQYQAMHYLRTRRPKVMYISYGETDEWAHHGNYSNYLDAAHQVDAWLNDIWNWVQTTEGYKDNTCILFTTDHGRGFGNEWTSHGAGIKGASSIWFALWGPGVNRIGAPGEQAIPQQLYQKQLAATVTKLIGRPFKAEHPVGDAIY